MGKSNKNNKTNSYMNKTGSYTDFYYHFFRNILLVGIPLVIISALILGFYVPHSSAEGSDITASDSFTVSISSSCTIRSNVEDAHVINVNAGSYTSELGSTKINTYCNDNNGYSIYAIGSSNNVDGNTDLVSNINDNYNISTGLYNSNTITPSSPSTWSMKLTAGTGTGINPDTGASVVLTPPTIVNGFNNYSLVPSTYTLVASRSSATDLSSNTDVTGSYFATTYDIYASSYQPAGTYSGKVKYLILHPQSNINTIPDIDAAFAIAGKQKQANVVDPVTGQTGNFYRMQDMTTDICNSISQNGERTSTQLVDIRDNKLYWVTKLKDGHCWMTQNLDLDLETIPTNIAALTSENTDLNDKSLTGAYAEGYNYGPNTSVLVWRPANNTNVWSNSDIYPFFKDRGKYYPEGTPTNETVDDYHKLSGNYYNWTAAIASNDSSSLQGSTYDNVGANPQNSICPRGWRLPTISSSNAYNEYNKLVNLYGNTLAKIITSPLWFVQSGYTNKGNIIVSGSYGFYWSSTIASSGTAYYLFFNGNGIDPANSDYSRSIGFSVRCVAR